MTFRQKIVDIVKDFSIINGNNNPIAVDEDTDMTSHAMTFTNVSYLTSLCRLFQKSVTTN